MKIGTLNYVNLFISICLFSCSTDDNSDQKINLVANDFFVSIDERPARNTILGTIQASASQGEIQFALLDQIPIGSIAVDPNSGDVIVADPDQFVFSIRSEITASVLVTSGTKSDNVAIKISINEPSSQFNIWSGEKQSFSKADEADPSLPGNQDRMTENVWITRGNEGGQIYNAKVEVWSESVKATAPADTEWAVGSTANLSVLTFSPFRDAVEPKDIVEKNLVMHLITDDVYVDVEFTQWSTGKKGGFAYERSTKEE